MKLDIKKLSIDCEAAIQLGSLEEIDNMIKSLLDAKTQVNDDILLFTLYFLGNLYSCKSKIVQEKSYTWKWGLFPENKVLALNYYRQIFNNFGEDFNGFYDVQVNMANELNGFCRIVEANRLLNFDYTKAIGDSWYIAPLNRAKNLRYISHYLNDSGHSDYYNYMAYGLLCDLKNNIDNIDYPQIKNHLANDADLNNFIIQCDKVKSQFKPFNVLYSDDGYSQDERNYRRWCLDNVLFLNPMNDITKEWVAAQDILQFPNYRVKANEGPFFSAAFSDIKRRYCRARHLAFEGFLNLCPKYEQQDLYLTDTLDYVDYSASTENLKIALRLCYSILDSLMLLMIQYFKSKPFKEAYFRPRFIKDNFNDIKNPFIDALYWISCDLFDNSNISDWKAPNPTSADLKILRDNMEHNWVRIVEFDDIVNNTWNNEHDYAKVITRESLEKYTMEMFHYTRDALLYFTFAVKHNEKIREEKDGLDLGINVPLY